MIRIANPIYDAVFKALMEDLDIARGVLSVILRLNIVSLRFNSQELPGRHPETGRSMVMRLDFCAVIETADGPRYEVIIEVQKAKLLGDVARFRYYLASKYMSVEDSPAEDGPSSAESLPIISIYLLGFLLDADLPLCVHVRRAYFDAVRQKKIANARLNDFIERLSHDAYFIQIPQITGSRRTALERILSVFDQSRCLAEDPHRLDYEEERAENDPVLRRMLRRLRALQENPEMERLLTQEDLFLLEQQRIIADETREIRRQLEQEQRRREQEQQRREQEQQRREQEQQRREQEQQRREAAEAEIERLRRLLDERGES